MLRKEYKTAAAAGKTPETAAVSNAWETTFREHIPSKSMATRPRPSKVPSTVSSS
jgi:hypothetical protein